MDPLEQLLRNIKSEVKKQYINTDYIESYVVFLDILGMKELVKNSYQEIRKIFNVIEEAQRFYGCMRLPSGDNNVSSNQIKMTVMSDSIVLSINSNIDYGLNRIVQFSAYLIQNLIYALSYPIFVRGAITKGFIYQNKNSVFGPALVKAYLLENDVAKSMRCIVDTALYSDVNFQNYVESTSTSLIKDSRDDLYFIRFVNEKNKKLLFSYTEKMLVSKANDDSVREKYEWLISYLKEW